MECFKFNVKLIISNHKNYFLLNKICGTTVSNPADNIKL